MKHLGKYKLMPYPELIKEHQDLVRKLESPSKDDDKELLKEQADELKQYIREYKQIRGMVIGETRVIASFDAKEQIETMIDYLKKFSDKDHQDKAKGWLESKDFSPAQKIHLMRAYERVKPNARPVPL